MKRRIEFGKIKLDGYKKKCNEVTVDLELREHDWGKEFTCCGYIWNGRRTDCIYGGQCLDTIAKYINTPLFNEIHRLWKKYHLNGMNAGTEEQEKAVDEYLANGNRYDYYDVCKYLKSIDLYEVDYNGKPYKYGTSWLHREIPENDLKIIESIMSNGCL